MTARGSWVPGSDGSGFPLDHLPFGACRLGAHRFLGVRIGDSVLDLGLLDASGAVDGLGSDLRAALRGPDLGVLLGLRRPAWTTLRERLISLLAADSASTSAVGPCLVPADDVVLGLPFPVADFVDFYSSVHHASNIGRMFRPDAEPLLPNWRRLPVGYHGRAGTVLPTGTPVRRPSGQRLDGDEVVFGPSTKLDIELEVGFVLGGETVPGRPVTIDRVGEHLFGVVLLNDWSARDIQAWEYVPLGPFLGKSFATSIAGWVTPIDALAPSRVPGPAQDPPVLPYLERREDWALDLVLTADLRPAGGTEATRICEVGFAGTYWTPDQQLAHLTANGASIRPGDLFGSGTVSGPEPGQRGSLIEASWNGAEPVPVEGGERTFLLDGDEVVLRGRAVRNDGTRIELGEVRGAVVATGGRLDSDPR